MKAVAWAIVIVARLLAALFILGMVAFCLLIAIYQWKEILLVLGIGLVGTGIIFGGMAAYIWASDRIHKNKTE